MKEVANAYLNTDVKSAVITVPAYFDDLQRQATKDAAQAAGLNVLRLLNEPTAAAIAYGLDKKATLRGRLKVIAVDGDTHLGGEDFDNRMVEHFVSKFNRMYKKDITNKTQNGRKALGRLRVASERAKRILSSAVFTSIEVDCFVRYAKWEKSMVDEVVLVGGSTRIPEVQQMWQDFFDGKELCKAINPDEAVAYGAAVLTAKMSGKGNRMVKNLTCSDVIPLSLGWESYGEVMCVVIPKNTPIPVTMKMNCVTIEDNQSSILFKVYQGERSRSTDNIFLAKNFKGRYERMLKDSKRYKDKDEEHRKKVEAYTALENYVYIMDIKLKDERIRKRLSGEDLTKMDDVVKKAKKWLDINEMAETNVIADKKNELHWV
nr:hypothetical protein [Tanacetum cinerariifolium]